MLKLVFYDTMVSAVAETDSIWPVSEYTRQTILKSDKQQNN
ncbi:hypothetical protein PPIS_b0995 [Pseudoalteromonas piscicida]|uniref:Uncharacterized protein n=1 Tax=Pseudoalteromonas piscicida TaxID=43662 RepID=A0ABM6NMC7_PSEO7|nr:hypothetical protein PPIS_b0995 [Pseudoalteromonas piscicida]